MPFTEPNRYSAREGWKQALITMVGGTGLPTNSFVFLLHLYVDKRRTKSVSKAWSEIGMSRAKATASLLKAAPTPTNFSGLIPPELFSRVLALAQGSPNEEVPVVLEPDVPVVPGGAVWMMPTATAAGRLHPTAAKAKAKRASRKPASRKKAARKKAVRKKAVGKKTVRKAATRRRGGRGGRK